jgi:BirA family biotin operon repressor/biotin-[acetyl-CoA-carboxylase] ligase
MILFPFRISNPVIGRRLLLYDLVSSTNHLMRDLALKGEPEGTVIVAEAQSEGRGRRDRVWYSPRGSGLYVTILLRPAFAPDQVGRISLLAALAVVVSIKKMTGLSAAIKWPNDIVINGKKVCGILIENVITPRAVRSVIIGIGINVNPLPENPPMDIRDNSTSLGAVLGSDIEKDELLRILIKVLNRLYRKLGSRKDINWLVSSWENSCAHLNQEVDIIQPDDHFSGIFRGIDNQGAAIVELPTSEALKIEYGTCSLRMV